jgi:penicillin-binding protein 2
MSMTRSHAIAVLFLLLALLASCGGTPVPTTLPPAAGNPADVATAFLNAWSQARYSEMYSLLTPADQAVYSEDDFIETYQSFAANAKLTSLSVQVVALLTEGQQARGRFRAAFSSQAVGYFERENPLTLAVVGQEWRVQWSPKMILPELENGDIVQVLYQASVRGNIYDQEGHALATQDTYVTIGVVPALIQDERVMLAALSHILGMAPDAIQGKYENAPRADWFMPIADISPEQNQAHYDELSTLPGVSLREKPRRAYPNGTLAAQILGYMGQISEEELKTWHLKGYQSGDYVGKSGLEAWAEPYLAGQRGTQLVVVTEAGQVRAVVAEQPAVHSRNVVVTLNTELQKATAEALGDRLGSIVALDPRTGAVLAMVSYPSFYPNDFAAGVSDSVWSALTSDARKPLLNRATQALYPPGSIFKVVTMAAGLEKAGFTAGSTFTCTGTWTGLGSNWVKTCYNRAGHGTLDLVLGLTQSCDVVFYTVGKALYDADPQALSDMAKAFGLGSLTGIDLTGESAGLVPDEAWKIQTKGEGWFPGDGVNLAIGQGDLLVTPLQMASLYAAIANGGTLYRPHLISEIPAWTDDQEDIVAKPEVVGTLPVSAEHLAAIQRGLEGVTQPPYGTSYKVFQGMPITVAGKSGTAENNFELPHSWWVGYAPAADPQIVVIAVVENVGEGSKFAAPVVRQVLEAWLQLR